MDLLPIAFLVLIVLMSGGIAVLSDHVGRKLGKKRLHIKGLRPKHVAQLGTFTVGIVVSFMTIAVVAVFSSDVRQWIRQGNRAIVQARAAKLSYREAQHALELAEREDKELAKINSKLQNSNTDAQRKLALTEIEERQLANQMESTRIHLKEVRSAYLAANRRIRRLNDEVEGRQQALTVLESRRRATDGQLRIVTGKLATVNEQIKALQASKDHVEGDLHVAINQKRQTDQDNQALMQEKERLTEQKARLEEDSAKASRALSATTQDLERTIQDLKGAQAELGETRTELAQAKSDDAFYRGITIPSRNAPMIYASGDEVARLAVPAGMGFERAQAAVLSLLRLARIEAKNRGAVAHGAYPEAGIFDHKDQNGTRLTTENLQVQIAEQIAGAKEPMVLIASSSLNAFRGEAVSLEIAAVPNPIVYSKNTLVAKASVDGRLETDVILKQLSILGEKVQQRAMADRMIPHTGSLELYGTVSSDQVLHLVDQVKATNREVEVRAFADADTRAADPLRLRFSVR